MIIKWLKRKIRNLIKPPPLFYYKNNKLYFYDTDISVDYIHEILTPLMQLENRIEIYKEISKQYKIPVSSLKKISF